MKELNKREDSPLILFSAIAILGVVNIGVFGKHYFDNECFPWDFWKLYYAIIPFWTTAIGQHVLPEWVPFEAMGYPFFINLQTSFFYPPLWLFVLPGIHHSLHAAVILQCLHVFWGACGAFFLLRVLTDDWRAALFGALAYEFFGGFYSNAQHMDIVRAYAWLPWLFWGATVKGSIQVRHYLLPAIFYCAATSSYPGNLISHGVFLGIYILYQFCQPSAYSTRKNIFIVVGLLVLGVLISAVALGPPFLLRNELSRVTEKVVAAPWVFTNWLSVIAPWTIDKEPIFGYSGDASMVSAFVGVPTLVLVILIRRTTAKAFAVWWLLLIVALLLSQGLLSMFYQIVVRILPVLGFSRMATSDYRGLIGLALIVLAAASLSNFLAAPQEARRELVRKRFKYLCLIPVIVMSGVFVVQLPAQEFVWLLVIWGTSVVVLWAPWSRFTALKLLPVSLLALLLLAGGWHVTSVSNWTWTMQGKDIDESYKRRIGFAAYTWPLPVAEKMRGVPTRPARIDRKRNDFSWAGYLDGTYQIRDYGNTVLKARAKLESDPVLAKYMLQPLSPLVFPSKQNLSLDIVRNRLEQSTPAASEGQNAVTPVTYGLNNIVYQVSLTTDSMLVENEIWFPGWKGKVRGDMQKSDNIHVTSVEHSLRAWHLPAGQYMFVTEFKTPYLRACAILSLVGLLSYLGVLMVGYRNWKTRTQILDVSGDNHTVARAVSQKI